MCDAEEPKCFQVITRKARKEHKCCECRKIISKGESYQYCSGIWDDPQSYKTCSSCVEVRDNYDNTNSCIPPFGSLSEYVQEQFYTGFGVNELIKLNPQLESNVKKLLGKAAN